MSIPFQSKTDFATSNRGTQSAASVRVVTLNLWGLRGAWTERRSVLRHGLGELSPDLVAFQEVITTDDYDQTVDLLGSDYYVAHQTSRATDGSGCSIASRWPLGDIREVNLHTTSRTADFPCATLVAEVLAPGPVRPLLFLNHNPNWQLDFERERELQAVAAARFVEALVGQRRMHVVLAGDFNAVPHAASVRFWCGLQSLANTSVSYRDVWDSIHPSDPGYTFSQRNPLRSTDWDINRRIDYIFVRCEHKGPTLDIASCALIFDEPRAEVWASDHFGIVADVAAPILEETIVSKKQ